MCISKVTGCKINTQKSVAFQYTNSVYWIGRLNIIKISGLPKLTYEFSTIPIKLSARFFFVDIDKIILNIKYLWKYKGTRIAKYKKKWEESCYLISRLLTELQ